MIHHHSGNKKVLKGSKLTEALLYCQVMFNVDFRKEADIEILKSQTLPTLHSSSDSLQHADLKLTICNDLSKQLGGKGLDILYRSDLKSAAINFSIKCHNFSKEK